MFPFYLIIKLLLLFHGSYYLKFTSSNVKFAKKNVPSDVSKSYRSTCTRNGNSSGQQRS